MEREECDAITMDCLGALGKSKVSLPCIAWSKMNDDGIPAACEADLGAVATHIIVQYLLNRPGFQQDPVPETMREAIVGAHCSCPTRLHGFGTEPEPYDIVHHHGARDATMRPVWRVGQPITCTDVLPGTDQRPTKMLISTGKVVDNVSVPACRWMRGLRHGRTGRGEGRFGVSRVPSVVPIRQLPTSARMVLRLQGIEPVVV